MAVVGWGAADHKALGAVTGLAAPMA